MFESQNITKWISEHINLVLDGETKKIEGEVADTRISIYRVTSNVVRIDLKFKTEVGNANSHS